MPTNTNSDPEVVHAPVAKRIPVTRERFGDVSEDDYAWLRDRDDPDLIELLTAENAYTDAVLAPSAQLTEQIYSEIKARTLETDLSVPYRKGSWWYYSRTVEGMPYRIHCRRADDGSGTAFIPAEDGGTEQVILDENELAEGHEYLALGAADVSPDGTLLAYSVDHAGDEMFLLTVKDLATGEHRSEQIPATSYGFAWAADNRTFFYTTLDSAQRPYRLHRHVLDQGDPKGADDVIVYEEADERFFVGVGLSRSGDFVAISLGSSITSEVWLIDAHSPLEAARVVEPRRQGIEYSVAHHGAHLYIVANDEAPNFALWRAPVEAPGRANWTPVLEHREDTRVEGVEAFARHLIVHLRQDATTGLGVLDPASGEVRHLQFTEEVRTVGAHVNEEFDTEVYRFGYQSLVTPQSVFEEHITSGERTLLKQQPVLGEYDPTQYTSARVWATADDGTSVPMSVVWRNDVPQNGTAPALLYGYGAYEASMDPWFSIARLSLLDRGMVFAIAHVRGGGDLGRHWYEDGKFANKPNSFTDFVACGRHLIAEKYCAPDRLAARGGSAGGLLMGAATNLAPDLFRAVLAEVPFVDALNTILDPSMPLTVIEWEEWGNPIEDESIFECMRAYSPYENIQATEYPAIYATGGLNDPRVGYHEPAKWVQRLRSTVANGADRPIVLRMEMGAGHGGPSGRYAAWRSEAETLAFALTQLGLSE